MPEFEGISDIGSYQGAVSDETEPGDFVLVVTAIDPDAANPYGSVGVSIQFSHNCVRSVLNSPKQSIWFSFTYLVLRIFLKVTYDFVRSTGTDWQSFRINAISGEITANTTYTRDRQTEYAFLVVATDTSISGVQRNGKSYSFSL